MTMNQMKTNKPMNNTNEAAEFTVSQTDKRRIHALDGEEVGRVVCRCESKEDAAFIVRACNSHAALVEALEKIVEADERGHVCLFGYAQKARAALALAKGTNGQQ